ncbi:hypothetical protein SAMN05421545_0485 [Pontibacter lucknowensis]|uniref:Uncharacterized protein n=1 Tax=Pontibacter lucknowensis TaxID=1077936 RepID=A0A1N6TSE2_9BACT|nr:hypothetical protein SAMN05421545_0485 [Pontibacter lucknowensis]
MILLKGGLSIGMLSSILGAFLGALAVFIWSHFYATKTPFYNLSYTNYPAIQKVLVYLFFLLFAIISAAVAFYILLFSIGIIFASLANI